MKNAIAGMELATLVSISLPQDGLFNALMKNVTGRSGSARVPCQRVV
jgi:hypothetical protein